jgi:hypothetical protein
MSRSEAKDKWSLLLSDQRSSGLTVRAFCESGDIDKAVFYGWRKRLEERSPDGPVDFLRVRVAAAAPPASLCVTIGRASVRVERDFDPRLLADLLDVLEARSC